MDERIMIIAEGLKGMNNSAIDLIKKGEYDKAQALFESAESTCRLFQYNDGVGMIRVSLANLSVMRGDLLEALTHVETAISLYSQCKEREKACELQRKIAMIALEAGIEKENSDDLKGALEIFERVLPYLNEKRTALVSIEIKNLREYIYQEDRTQSI